MVSVEDACEFFSETLKEYPGHNAFEIYSAADVGEKRAYSGCVITASRIPLIRDIHQKLSDYWKRLG
jgi:hypothetical protein